MAHYRKIDTRILLDRKFNALSSDARLAFFHLLVHINLTSLGAMRASVPGLADELNWEVNRFEEALLELCQNDMARYDKTARFLWLPNFLKYNLPESPNVIKSWETALSYLPECELRNALMRHVKQFVSELSLPFQEALPNCFQVTAPGSQSNNAKTSCAPKSKTESSDLPSGSPIEAIVTSSRSSIDVIETPFENPHISLPEGSFENRLPLSKSLNIKHKALSIKQEQEQEQKKLIQKNNSEEKLAIEEINNIVAKSRQKNAKPPDADIVEVFSYWKQTMNHPQAMLDAKRHKRIRQALASGYSPAQLCEAILGCSYTPHNMGDNEQGQRYDSVHVIFRDADQIDRFIRNAHSPPKPQNAADKAITIGKSWMYKKMQEQAQKEKTVYECG